MNGPQHYREAERLLHEVNREQAPNFEGTIRPVYHDGLRAEMIAAAQVHATLALAAANVQDVTVDFGGHRWRATLSAQIKHACGSFIAGGHETYDPDCGACVEANSDAPEWTTS